MFAFCLKGLFRAVSELKVRGWVEIDLTPHNAALAPTRAFPVVGVCTLVDSNAITCVLSFL